MMLSSGIWRRADIVRRIDISEENIVVIFKVIWLCWPEVSGNMFLRKVGSSY
jgi:hypothetical protein